MKQLLLIMLLLSAVVISACSSSSEDELKTQLSVLQADKEQLQDQIEDQDEAYAQQQDNIDDLNKQITDLETEIARLNELLAEQEDPNTTEPQPEAFCGWSSQDECQTDADCKTAGCSGQLCVAADTELQTTTTCEIRDCFNDEAYGVACGCVNGQCQWA